ncbi:hypothetical protein HNV12_04020 [Methanococcoides sp. SA1]|nr:hypothetical protein [Methanococcoides sp. SA1]
MVSSRGKFWHEKIPFLRESKKVFREMEYEGINLWPIMASEVYTYYGAPEKIWWRKIAMMGKFLFTLDKYNITGEKNAIFSSFIMARDDHRDLVKKSLAKFSKKYLIVLDACEYKKSLSILKFSYHFPNIPLLLKIWGKFHDADMKKVWGRYKYYHFIARTYFRCKQIDQFLEIYDNYKPRAYIAFCSQAFPEEGIMTLICKKNGVPTFTLQHGIVTEYNDFSPNYVLMENIISDYFLIWGKSTENVLKKYIEKKKLVIVGNPKIGEIKENKKIKLTPKIATVFLPVISNNDTNIKMFELIDDFSIKNPTLKIELSLHPFDNIKKYPKPKSKKIKLLDNSIDLNNQLKKSDFIIIHNTTIAMEALKYQKPIFRYEDDFLVKLWENDDCFKTAEDLNMLIKKGRNKKTYRKWIKKYKNEFEKTFYQSKKSIGEKYRDEIVSRIR